MKPTTGHSLRTVAAAALALVASVTLLTPAGTLLAVMIRRHWPDAWFSGLIVWYFDIFTIGLSLAIAAIVGRSSFRAQRRLE